MKVLGLDAFFFVKICAFLKKVEQNSCGRFFQINHVEKGTVFKKKHSKSAVTAVAKKRFTIEAVSSSSSDGFFLQDMGGIEINRHSTVAAGILFNPLSTFIPLLPICTRHTTLAKHSAGLLRLNFLTVVKKSKF